MTEISLGREYYHLQDKMYAWCQENLGVGGWNAVPTIPNDVQWGIDCAFGNTHFYFRNAKDATWFALTWVK